ncbi:MAG: beta-propeller fold lactonase family protein [Candidatus Koribacter versatilis]|uniref:Beta-propeller fold lactonase family protein n=1 Tax=Candidatus Korobacter versatilis TaxID=658062 RepID=A0A932EP32_9BACT|nr:beta-propeller fold lactonase family protein [Candidatus Koribacter versatilis]
MNRSRKHFVLALALLVGSALAILGCSSGELAHILGGTNGTIGIPAFVITGDFDGFLRSFSVNTTTGALTEAPGSPFSAVGCPWGVMAHPSGKFVFVGDDCGSGGVEVFSVNTTTGALTSLGQTPLSKGNASWTNSIGVTPSGKWLYVANGTDLDGFAVNTTSGALTPLAGFPVSVGGGGDLAFSVSVDPQSRFVAALDRNSGEVYMYTLNDSTGALTPVAGSPFDSTLSSPEVVLFSGTGGFVYVSSQDSVAVMGFKVNSTTGALTPIAGLPVDTVSTEPFQIVADPLGRFLYALTDNDAQVVAYSIDPTTGALTEIAGSPFDPPGESQGGAVDPSGRFLYLGDCDNAQTDGLTIGSTGALTNMAGSPFGPVGDCSSGVAVTRK